jgi:hypothetical protein
MRIRIDVTAHEGWSGVRGTTELIIESEADPETIKGLPWEAICTNLVQMAIANFEAERDGEGEEGED